MSFILAIYDRHEAIVSARAGENVSNTMGDEITKAISRNGILYEAIIYTPK
jgi:hypothetical protein